MRGQIKRLTRDKGFGFLRPEDGSPDRFFHRSGLVDSTQFDHLVEGQRVEFEDEDSPKGPRATRVRAV